MKKQIKFLMGLVTALLMLVVLYSLYISNIFVSIAFTALLLGTGLVFMLKKPSHTGRLPIYVILSEIVLYAVLTFVV